MRRQVRLFPEEAAAVQQAAAVIAINLKLMAIKNPVLSFRARREMHVPIVSLRKIEPQMLRSFGMTRGINKYQEACIMTNKLIAFLIITFIGLASVSFLYGEAVTYNPSFNAEGMKYLAAPTSHVPGKDNGAGIGLHNAGEDCGMCHTPNGKAGNYAFTIGGTIYEDRAARRTLKGAEVILQDISGKVISMTTNEAGNFWTYTPIAGNPYSVSSHSGITDIL